MLEETYSVGKQQQLIDLNNETVNFDITFECVSENKAPFDAVVVDQKTLDETPTFDFKSAEDGAISGNIKSDNNEPETYFLVLKAQTPCKVKVRIDKQEIEPAPLPEIEEKTYDQVVDTNQDSGSLKKIMLGAVILGGGALLCYFYLQGRRKTASHESVFEPPNVPASPVPSVASSNPVSPPPSSLAEKLKNLSAVG
tara:strand:+ start:10371 stop:10961 length:591 start_codon:yes stop_codon:yes gene_type:complete